MRVKALRVLLAIASVLAGLLIAELALRILNKPKPAISGWRAVGVSSKEQNQLGFRGQQIQYTNDDFVIVMLGDSQVEAKACAYEWMPERRLQFYLAESGRKVKVFSVGASGYGQDQELLALREYFDSFRANLVLLWETPVNDIWNNVFPSSMPAAGTPKPTFWLENGQLHGPSEQIGQVIREASRVKLIELWRKNIHWSRDHSWEKYYPPPYKPMTDFHGDVKDDWQQLWNTNDDFRREDIATEKSNLATPLTPRSERMQYGLDLTHRLISEIEKLGAAHGAQLVCFVGDNYLSGDDALRGDGVHVLNGRYYRISAAQYWANIDVFNHGFRLLRVPVTVSEWRVGPENPHLNEHANDQVMKGLAKQLEQFIPPTR
jgi:hypothetical protein